MTRADARIALDCTLDDRRILREIRTLTGLQSAAEIVRLALRELFAAERRRLPPAAARPFTIAMAPEPEPAAAPASPSEEAAR